MKKEGSDKWRLIFDLSYPPNQSINHFMPAELCSVKYKDSIYAVDLCQRVLDDHGTCWLGKTDLKAAFRQLPIHPQDWSLLVMQLQKPGMQEHFYFVDKALPFGSSISCSHYERFSDALAHIHQG